MSDGLESAVQAHVSDPTPTPATKPKRAPSFPVGRARKQHAKLAGFCEGAAANGTEARFAGPLSLPFLLALTLTFTEAEAELVQARRRGRGKGAAKSTIAAQVESIHKVIQGYAEVFHGDNAEARAQFQPGPGQHGLGASFAASIHGVKWDKAQAQPLLPHDDPELDAARLDGLLADYQAGGTDASAAGITLDAARTKRNAIGAKIRSVTPKAEALIRLLHRNEPDKLAAYGLKPLRFQVTPKPGDAKLRLVARDEPRTGKGKAKAA